VGKNLPFGTRFFVAFGNSECHVCIFQSLRRFKKRVAGNFKAIVSRPGVSISLSFLLAIFIGAGLLSLPQATITRERLAFVDALFISTSATCVTGLTVVGPEYLSRYGQTVVLLLIQAGGLGIMTWAILFRVILRRRMAVTQQAVMVEFLGLEHRGALKSLLGFMVAFTFTVEAIGFFVLLSFFLRNSPDTGDALFRSVFHSVSAFCNAGFSTFNDNLKPFRGSVHITVTITFLVILGGLGVPVLYNLWQVFLSLFREEETPRRVSLHTQLCLITSAALVGLGFGLFYLFERGHSLKGLPWQEQVMASYFHAVTPRTSGFDTIDIGTVSGPGLMLLMFLMFVGGSPGSTAGGIKTTTLATLMTSLAAFCRGREEVECFGRTIAKEVIDKALVVALWGILVVLAAALALLNTEGFSFEDTVFEVFSAFDTVGLSTGITPHLSLAGKVIIMVTMFVGRIGPLTLALMVSREAAPPGIRYPEEHVSVG
jgi:trk system potassium uptake protein TrkH